MVLKELAIYQLPNGRELVARIADGERVILSSLNISVPGQYELNPSGRLLLNGQLTAWEIADLLETGRFATIEATAALGEVPGP